MQFQKAGKWAGLILVPMLLATAIISAQRPAPTAQQGTTFRATTNYVTTDIIVRDQNGQFIPDLKTDDFRVLEDGVPQKITNFVVSIGGRVLGNVASAPAPAAAVEGLVLPPSRPQADASGRIFIVFIDDLHLQPLATPSVKQLLRTIRDTLVHENDLVGFVSTGFSSIASDLTYDFGHRRFNEAIEKMMGSGLTYDEIVGGGDTAEGPTGVRYQAHVAFSTAYDMLSQLAKVTNRKKSFIYVSNGYHLDPFRDSRYKRIQERYGYSAEDTDQDGDGQPDEQSTADPLDQDYYKQKQVFAFADLVGEIAQLVRTAQRANVTFYTVDPRGLGAGNELMMDRQMKYEEMRDFIQTQHSSLKVLAEETGGFCLCNTNDFKGGLQRIDNETSDYYIVGYYSTNPDPLRVRRRVTVEVLRPNVQQSKFESEYTIRRN